MQHTPQVAEQMQRLLEPVSPLWIAERLGVTRHDLYFFHDECAFIHSRSLWDWSDLMRPHNEHWSLVPVIAWRLVQDTFGVDSYLPFRVLVLVAHIALAAGVFAFLLRIGPLTALAGASLMLLLGSAWENIFWAFQVGFVGSAAFGVWALLALDQRRYAVSALLLTLSLATSGMGIPFMAAAVALVVLRPARQAAWLLVPMAAWATWFAAYGAAEVNTFVEPDFLGTPPFIAQSVGYGLGALSGVPVAGAVLLALAGWALWHGWRPSTLVLAAAFGILVEFAIIGALQRLPNATRYQTTFAAFVFIGIAGIRWPGTRVVKYVALALFTLALVVNVRWLATGPDLLTAYAAEGLACDPLVAPTSERGY